MMAFVFRVVLFVLLITLLRFVFARIFGVRRRTVRAPGNNFQGRPRTIAGKMVKDPQCGIYVASELALPLRSGGETLHFCSPGCRDDYLNAKSVPEAAAP